MARTSHREDLELLIDAARHAGQIALRFFRKDPKVWWKEGNSPVSEADYAVDLYLKQRLLGARPDYGWLSEETDPAALAMEAVLRPARFFVVDPIDGTRAYIRGEDTWCVSIAVVENGRPVAGVIDAAAKAEVFSAVAGGPAHLGGMPLAVTNAGPNGRLTVSMPDPVRKRLDAGTGSRLDFAHNAPSLAYRLALVACGRLDGTLIRAHANDWDIAAGDLILEQAGGALVDGGGRSGHYEIQGRRHGVLVAAAPHALPTLLDLAASVGA